MKKLNDENNFLRFLSLFLSFSLSSPPLSPSLLPFNIYLSLSLIHYNSFTYGVLQLQRMIFLFEIIFLYVFSLSFFWFLFRGSKFVYIIWKEKKVLSVKSSFILDALPQSYSLKLFKIKVIVQKEVYHIKFGK